MDFFGNLLRGVARIFRPIINVINRAIQSAGGDNPIAEGFQAFTESVNQRAAEGQLQGGDSGARPGGGTLTSGIEAESVRVSAAPVLTEAQRRQQELDRRARAFDEDGVQPSRPTSTPAGRKDIADTSAYSASVRTDEEMIAYGNSRRIAEDYDLCHSVSARLFHQGLPPLTVSIEQYLNRFAQYGWDPTADAKAWQICELYWKQQGRSRERDLVFRKGRDSVQTFLVQSRPEATPGAPGGTSISQFMTNTPTGGSPPITGTPTPDFSGEVVTSTPSPTSIPSPFGYFFAPGQRIQLSNPKWADRSAEVDPGKATGLLTRDFNLVAFTGTETFTVMSPVYGSEVKVVVVDTTFGADNNANLGNFVVISLPPSALPAEVIDRLQTNNPTNDPSKWSDTGRIYIAAAHLSSVGVQPGDILLSPTQIQKPDGTIVPFQGIGVTGMTGLENIEGSKPHLDLGVIYAEPTSSEGRTHLQALGFPAQSGDYESYIRIAQTSNLNPNQPGSYFYAENIDPLLVFHHIDN